MSYFINWFKHQKELYNQKKRDININLNNFNRYQEDKIISQYEVTPKLLYQSVYLNKILAKEFDDQINKLNKSTSSSSSRIIDFVCCNEANLFNDIYGMSVNIADQSTIYQIKCETGIEIKLTEHERCEIVKSLMELQYPNKTFECSSLKVYNYNESDTYFDPREYYELVSLRLQ